jgi:TonB family protein
MTRATVSLRRVQCLLIVSLLLTGGIARSFVPTAWAEEAGERKAKVKTNPKYPDLARRMKIAGVVKVQAVIAPNGSVKNVRVLGGHPVLANAVIDALQNWRFENAPQETTETLEFRFDPNE